MGKDKHAFIGIVCHGLLYLGWGSILCDLAHELQLLRQGGGTQSGRLSQYQSGLNAAKRQ